MFKHSLKLLTRGYGTNQQSKGKWKSQMTKVTSKMINGLTLEPKFCYVPIPAWSFFGHEVILGAAICDTLCTFFDISRITTEKGNNRDNRGNLDLKIFLKKKWRKNTTKKVVWQTLITFPSSLPIFILTILALFSSRFHYISVDRHMPLDYLDYLSLVSLASLVFFYFLEIRKI